MNKILSAIIITLLISSCATIFVGKKKAVVINSNPSQAGIYDDNDSLIGTTPFTITSINKKDQEYTIKKEGYDSATVTVSKKSHNEYLFMDALLLCLPCIVDVATDAHTYIQSTDSLVELRKKLPKHDPSINVAVGKAQLEFKDTRDIGRINNETKKLKDRYFERIMGNIENVDDYVMTTMKANYLVPSYEYELDFARSSTKTPKLVITPFITDINFDYKGRTYLDYHGTATINVKWKFFKTLDRTKAVAELNLKTTSTRSKGNDQKILSDLMDNATRHLLALDTLYKYLQSLESNYYTGLKGDTIVIQQAPALKASSLKEMLKTASSAVVTVETDDGFGSGVFISNDGYLITNYHVIEEEKSPSVKLNQGIKLNAEVVKTNKEYDLALLKINATDLKALRFGDSDSTGVGDDIYAIGTPLDAVLGQTVTKGIISGYREFKEWKYIQTDVSINAGNSGGPLINDKGEILGIATWKVKETGVEGIGFGIPANSVLEMLNIKWKPLK